MPQLDFAADARELVREQGHASVWDYMRAHPGVPTHELADRLGGPPAVVLEGLAVQEALARREMPELIRDLVLRDLHRDMRNQMRDRKNIFTGEIEKKIGHGEPFTFHHHFTMALRDPYRRIEREIWETFMRTPPPRDWNPTTPDDPLLGAVYDQAVAALSAEDQSLFERGEIRLDPGDAYRAAIGRYDVNIYDGPKPFLTDFAKVPPELGHVIAAHWCQSEVNNGGFFQFFSNSTGVLAPEAAAGFAAIGMPRAAEAVRKAMSVLGQSYPRRRWWRKFALARAGKRVAELEALSNELTNALREEGGGFESMADAYVRRA
ncbi:DMP19 family protein [Pendulispora brunnea]|uniref:DMP19 family protein n=1 Tax=Pendulispora brunnea TaxID=2905690 RepID=A0ABZ2KF01_9BACT